MDLEFDVVMCDLIVSLDDPRCRAPARVGRKAATLARLRGAGLEVPEGFVCTVDARPTGAKSAGGDGLPAELLTAIAKLDEGPWAVRSSAVEEDGDASFAGLYASELEVHGPTAVAAAIERCWRGAGAAIEAYREGLGRPPDSRLAILVQRQIDARAAGVAASVDPGSGAAGVRVSAVLGLGAELLAGTINGEDWRVEGERAECRGEPEVLTPARARAVAALLVRVEAALGLTGSVQIEWALDDDTLYLLQARPLTSAPKPPAWAAPRPGAWARHLRLGEWLGAPLTPLAATWLIPGLERGAADFRLRWVGLPSPEPTSVLVNGWYYTTVDTVPSDLRGTLMMIGRLLVHLVRDPRRASIIFAGRPSDPGSRACRQAWVKEFVPRRDRLLRDAEGDDEHGHRALARLEALVEVSAFGFGLLSGICNAAWKAELLLVEFVRAQVEGLNPRTLLLGIEVPTFEDHAVFSLDWGEPSVAERGLTPPVTAVAERVAAATKLRDDARERVSASLSPRARARFDALLLRAEQLARARSRAVQEVTRAWPCMRRILLTFGTKLVGEGWIERNDDVFFLEHRELEALVKSGDVDPTIKVQIAARRRARSHQARLSPPLYLGDGELPVPFKRALEIAEILRQPATGGEQGDIWHCLPASPGRAAGRAHILNDPSDLANLGAGEVLITSVLTPAWVPLSAHAAAVVVATGNHLSHASVLARELALPCVVGARDCVAELCTGDHVEVDGGSGTVVRIVE
ncbi:Chondramide synthase cmdD [Enhygromyxa salina]|uniref:Chondramide synthase cmdD n=1 Tax=Enhygromyxa salina TaxID=215803 RepID=A0A2S9XX04_9BACT|nr:PEP/pyruvate-binding domain-containing protein [Enhygromyxa salina]PRP97396.1 Chondramide synthase cmdD [Enhygromyxa salina]